MSDPPGDEVDYAHDKIRDNRKSKGSESEPIKLIATCPVKGHSSTDCLYDCNDGTRDAVRCQ